MYVITFFKLMLKYLKFLVFYIIIVIFYFKLRRLYIIEVDNDYIFIIEWRKTKMI